MESEFAPGDFVEHPTEKAWGVGQVQSVIGSRITANFQNSGKQLINGDKVSLIFVEIGTEID